MKKRRRTPEWYAARIDANVDMYMDDEISYEEFDARQRAVWDEIGSGALEQAVLDIVAPKVVLA